MGKTFLQLPQLVCQCGVIVKWTTRTEWLRKETVRDELQVDIFLYEILFEMLDERSSQNNTFLRGFTAPSCKERIINVQPTVVKQVVKASFVWSF